MKYTLSLIALCSALHSLPVHAMFTFTEGTTEQIAIMLRQMNEVATENKITDNPAALVYESMRTTINKNGLPALVAQAGINKWMHTMRNAYKGDELYTAALATAQKSSQEKPNDESTKNDWNLVMKATIASLTTVTERNSSFKCPRGEQDKDYKVQYLTKILEPNKNANIEDRDVWAASTLTLYYQMDERKALMQEATPKSTQE